MTGLGKDLVGATGLDDRACVHHVDALAHSGHNSEVVRDQDERGAPVRDELAQEIEDLRLNRHVECGRRLVGDEELGLAGKGHRDHDPLAHAAGELVRVVAVPRLRVRDADLREKFDDALVGLASREIEVRRRVPRRSVRRSCAGDSGSSWGPGRSSRSPSLARPGAPGPTCEGDRARRTSPSLP